MQPAEKIVLMKASHTKAARPAFFISKTKQTSRLLSASGRSAKAEQRTEHSSCFLPIRNREV
jgi:hypothetical protein